MPSLNIASVLMFRKLLPILFVVALCHSMVTNAQNIQFVQVTQNPQSQHPAGQIWQASSPEQLLMQSRHSSQYANAGNYDLTSQSTQSVQTIITRLSQIDIPFAISATNQQKVESVELVYSLDQGKIWHHYQTLKPSESKFEFNAAGDAEYWFVIRAKFKTGEVRQLGPTPSARAIVDTHPPQLTLNARRNTSGEVIIEWSIEDAALKKSGFPTISLSYDSNITWMTLAVDPKNVKREGNRETGYVTFWPNHDAIAVEIRCDSEDAAGNKEIQTTRLGLKQPQNETPLHQAEDQVGHLTTNLAATDDQTATQPVPDITVTPPRPTVTHHRPTQQNSNSTAVETPVVTKNSDNVTSDNASNNMLMELVRTMGGSPPEAVAADVEQRYANQTNITDTANKTASRSSSMPGMLTNVPMPRYVPTNDSHGSTVANAQNADNSRTIAKLPDEVTADRGVAFPGKIEGVSLGYFGEQQCIIVRWLEGETYFAESKVDLYRSETRHGPWRPIAFDLTNSGEYYWLVSAVDKMPFYLRIDLRSQEGLFTDFTVQTIALPLSFDVPESTTTTTSP